MEIPEELVEKQEISEYLVGFEENDEKLLTNDPESSRLDIMSDRIENKFTGIGVPNDIYRHGRPLNSRQQSLLDALPDTGSRATFDRDAVSMADLSALTAKTGDEFAMFTLGGERVVMRGDAESVVLTRGEVDKMAQEGYRWSGHTHPGGSKNMLRPSVKDKEVLKVFRQRTSVIYNSVGDYQTFTYDLEG